MDADLRELARRVAQGEAGAEALLETALIRSGARVVSWKLVQSSILVPRRSHWGGPRLAGYTASRTRQGKVHLLRDDGKTSCETPLHEEGEPQVTEHSARGPIHGFPASPVPDTALPTCKRCLHLPWWENIVRTIPMILGRHRINAGGTQ